MLAVTLGSVWARRLRSGLHLLQVRSSSIGDFDPLAPSLSVFAAITAASRSPKTTRKVDCPSQHCSSRLTRRAITCIALECPCPKLVVPGWETRHRLRQLPFCDGCISGSNRTSIVGLPMNTITRALPSAAPWTASSTLPTSCFWSSVLSITLDNAYWIANVVRRSAQRSNHRDRHDRVRDQQRRGDDR